MRYTRGDWIQYKNEGWTTAGSIVLSVLNSDEISIGTHLTDPEPKTISQDRIVGKVSREHGKAHRYSRGDKLTFKHPQGWSKEGIVLAVRPDNMLIIGDSKSDTNPTSISPEEIIKS